MQPGGCIASLRRRREKKAKIFDAKTQRRKVRQSGNVLPKTVPTSQIPDGVISILDFFASWRLCVEDLNAGAKPVENVLRPNPTPEYWHNEIHMLKLSR